jgi:hypothetical protein
MKAPKVLPAEHPADIAINLGTRDRGLLHPTAGVFINGRAVPGVIALRIEADVAANRSLVHLTLEAAGMLTVVGHAAVTVEQDDPTMGAIVMRKGPE